MKRTTVELGEVCDFLSGFAFKSELFSTEPIGLPIIRIRDVLPGSSATFYSGNYQPQYIVEKGDILIGMDGEFNRERWKSDPALLNQRVCKAIARERFVDNGYLYHALPMLLKKIEDETPFVTVKHLSVAKLKSAQIPLPPLEEQRRIAAILDKANELIRLRSRHQALSRDVELSTFYNEFGSPVANAFGWPIIPLAEMAEIFSDGPFGSNLKSSHYVDSGIRVVRLQNIGVGVFLDDDKAYVSTSHYETIKKHSCLPGDVLIGTLGDPNLRACILPDGIPVAINKADCIQMRCDKARCTPEYISHLLNLPETNQLASKLILGQTRGRISMGRLKGLEVPLPPLEKQAQFVKKMDSICSLGRISASSASSLRDLASSFSSATFAL